VLSSHYMSTQRAFVPRPRRQGVVLAPGVDLSRRRMLVGVGLAAIPIILMITAPEARAATSQCTPTGSICSPQEPPCCSGSTCTPGPTGTCL
jgi:hypothetical protein